MIDNPNEELAGVRVLILDDEQVLAWSMAKELQAHGADTKAFATISDAERAFAGFDPDVAICDIRLPDGDGLELAGRWRRQRPSMPIIIITAHGAVDTAISAVRLSAFDYLQKPFHLKDLLAAVRRASEVSQLRQKVEQMAGKATRAVCELVGESAPIARLRQQIARVGKSPASTVLISGGTGTGKELVARMIHEASSGHDKPYVTINCASIPDTLLESELFGFEKGAFTDARSRKLGLFEIACEGSVFLDEVGELPLKLQSKLLRALESRTFRRLGGIKDISFNARIIAATNRNLAEFAREGGFRVDLFFRLNVIHLHIPPVRERGEDVFLLFQFFLRQYCESWGLSPPSISPEARQKLLNHTWPGNVRELKNTVERTLVLNSTKVIRPEHLSLEAWPEGPKQHDRRTVQGASAEPDDSFPLPEQGISLENLEKSLLSQALERSHYNQSRAAGLLGISRHTLRYRMEKHGLV